MTKQNVLVFPCGSELGLELFRAMSKCAHVTLFGASSISSNHGKYWYDSYIEGIPFVDHPDFVAALNRVIEEHQIDFLFPAIDSVLLKCAEAAADLHCKVVGSPVDTCTVCCSKRTTLQSCAGVLLCPRLYDRLSDCAEWPVFLKPDRGYGARGTCIAWTPEEAQFYLSQDPSRLILEYLPGPEYTVDCFTDRHGKLRFVGARERVRIMNGISVHSRPTDSPEFRTMADALNDRFRFRGVWFFQVKRNREGVPSLMEIAPRIAGAMGLYRNVGVNFALLSLYDAMDLDVELLPNSFLIEMDSALHARYSVGLDYRHLYIDFDDCLVCNGQVNTQAIALIYQCINRGIEVHLITRHEGSLEDMLSHYRANSLFDEIIHVTNGEPKSRYVRHEDAVFIDDSFSERKNVLETLGVPVFAPDAIECLLR